MKRVKYLLNSLLILIGSLVIAGGILVLAVKLLANLDKTIAAIIAFIGVVLVAVINNNFIRTNQIEAEKRMKKLQIESEERTVRAQIAEEMRKEKQNNYIELLSLIGNYIRNPDHSNDDFLNVHIRTWIYGTQEVISKTAELIRINRSQELNKFDEALEELIRLIRADTGATEINDNLKIVSPFVKREIRGT